MNQENKEISNERGRAGELPAEKGHPPVEENEADIFPMSFAQRRMWFFYQLDPADPAYNVPLAIRLTGRLHCEILERCINALIERHEGLRTTFKLVDDQPVQVVWPELSLPLPLVDLTGSTEEEIDRYVAEQARRPFDLVAGPVIRTTLFRLGEHEHIFLLNCHHIAVDGWALGIFYRELQTLYNAYIENKLPDLPALPIQYADFTQWQLQKLQGETLEKLLHYWKRQLGGNLPTLRLPVEQSRQGVRSARGARLPVVHSPQTLEKLHQFCRRTGSTLFMVLLAAFQTLLHRYSGQDDILVGSPIANRNRVEIEGIIGFFANTLVLRTDLSGDPPFLDLLKRVHEVTLGAYAHQDLPFERLVEELQPERSLSQNPLFQHIFALQKPPEIARKFAGLQAELIEYQSNIIKFDLEFILWESAGELSGFMNYNQDLFSAETIAHMIEHWLILVDDAVSFPTKHVSELALMSALERRQVLRETQPAPSQEANEISLLHCFEQQVARTPEKPALLAGEILLNYQHLAQKVYRLARSLRSLGVKAEVPVGLLMDHSIDEVVCLLAILKAGGACVPLDPTIPPELLSFVIKDAHFPLLLTQQRYLHHLPPAHPELVVLCTSEGEISQGQGNEDGDLPDDTEPGNLASILYVADRGILLEHRGLLEHLRWRQATFPISPEDTVLLSPLPGSIQALWEILWPLLQGACLYLSGEEQRDDPAAFWHFVNEHQASVIHTTPAQLKAFPATFGVQARLLLCYGEQLSPATIETLSPHFNGKLHLLAPLPEAATCIAYSSLATGEQFAGEPLRAVSPTHVQMYILDKYRQPLPVGIPGELFVASGGLARGYTHGTSDERFFTHSFNLAPDLPGRIFQTRKYARFLRDGTLELLASLDRRVTLHGYELSLPLIEEALLRNASVVDCAVLLREAAREAPVLVAYVVLNSSLSVERLEAHMHQLLPPFMAPAFYVPVSAIPLTPDGEIDEPALCSLEIIERELLQHWEERLLSIPEIERVAVLAQERREKLPLLHLSDLFSDWREMFGQTTAPRSTSAALSSMNETPSAQERKLAQSSGAELVIEPHAPQTLAEALERSARLAPTEKIIYLQQDETELSHTHRELLEEAECILMGLRQRGLQPQNKILFQLELAQDFVAAFWGCVLGGFVPVPLSIAPTYAQANSAVSKLQSAWQALDHPVVLASSHLTAPLREMAEEADLAGFQVLDIQSLRACPPEHSWHQSDPDETALLLLTSGSTGAPKGVMLSHHNLLCRSAATIQMNRFTRQDVLLNWMPLDHVGGIVMYHLLGMYLSCRQIHVSIQTILQDPLKWLDLVDHYRVTNTWAPNFAYGLVNAQAEELARRRWDLSSLGFILNGGEAVVARTARRFLELLQPHGLPATAMHPAWGMSETSSGVTFSQDFTLEKTTDTQEHVEVGAPIPGVSLRIVDANDQVVEEGITGRLQVKGLPVTRGYYQRPDLNAEAFTSDGWFNTGDLGMILNGNLTITGRAKDTIIVNGVNIYSHDVEALIEELEPY